MAGIAVEEPVGEVPAEGDRVLVIGRCDRRRRIREGLERHSREDLGQERHLGHVSRRGVRGHERIVGAKKRDDRQDVLVRRMRELHHVWRRVAPVAPDPGAKQIRDLAVGPRPDALGRVLRDVGGVDDAELGRHVGHPPAREHASRGVEMAGHAQHLRQPRTPRHALGRRLDFELQRGLRVPRQAGRLHVERRHADAKTTTAPRIQASAFNALFIGRGPPSLLRLG